MRNGCGNIIFDASIRYDEGRLGVRRVTKTISSSSQLRMLLQFSTFLLTEIKENQLGKMSVIRLPGESSGLIGENEGNIPRVLV